jgi:hypothetical protein
MILRATLRAVLIVGVCFIVYIAFFHHYDPTANNIAAYELQQQLKESTQRVDKASVYLENKDFAKAQEVVLPDFEKFKNAEKGIYQTERSVYNYTVFMLAPDDDPIVKYAYIQFAKPIVGILTQNQLDQFIAEWKPKSEKASANVQKQIDEAFVGLSSDEKLFVELYTTDSIGGKKPDPTVEAARAMSKGTVRDSDKKAKEWMQDPRILEAIKKYNAV